MESFGQNLRLAIRGLVRTPGFTLVAILILALGIGATAAIFTLVNALLIKPLPFDQPERLMLTYLRAPDFGAEGTPGSYRDLLWSYPKYTFFRDQQQVFERLALFQTSEWNMTDAGDPIRLRGESIGAGYLAVLGVTPALGRDFGAEEDRAPGVAPVVLLGHALWQERFAGDPNVLGRTIRLNAIPHTIVGVAPPTFRGLTGEALLWVPMTSNAAPLDRAWVHTHMLIGRRKPGVSAEEAESQVRLLGTRLNSAFPPPGSLPPNLTFGAATRTLDDARVDPVVGRAALILLGAVGCVVLIGCVNLANLMLTRGAARQREVAIRISLGATRARLVRWFLAESLLLAGLGALAGLGVAYAALHAAGNLLPDPGIVLRAGAFNLTRVGAGMMSVDRNVLLFSLGLATLTVLLFGLLPALHASRSDVSKTLKAGGAGAIGGPRVKVFRHALVVLETAFALALLVGASLMLQSVRNLSSADLGFEPNGLITTWVTLPEQRYDAARATRFLAELPERLGTLPGVQAAAYGSCAPVSGGCGLTLVTLPDRPAVRSGMQPTVGLYWASPSYFEAMSIRLRRGRLFTDRDREGQPPVVVVNETAARKFWPGEDPIGKRLGVGQPGADGRSSEVVGVVADVRYLAVERTVLPDVYVPLLQSPRSSGFMFIRGTLDVATLTRSIRQELVAFDRDLPVTNVKTMGDRFDEATWRTRLSADLLGVFAAVALLLASIGLYGVLAQSVEQQMREIGVRMALGADRPAILRLILGRALRIVGIGIALGIGLSMASTRFLESLLFQVRSDDVATVAGLSLVLLAVATIASYVPARRAMRVDPLTILRTQ